MEVKPVPIFWITMNRPGPLGNAQANEPVNHDAYNSKAQVTATHDGSDADRRFRRARVFRAWRWPGPSPSGPLGLRGSTARAPASPSGRKRQPGVSGRSAPGYPLADRVARRSCPRIFSSSSPGESRAQHLAVVAALRDPDIGLGVG